MHPNEIPRLVATGELDAAFAEVERVAAHPRVRVVGETGLDYFRTGPDGVPAQQEAFRRHIDLAKRTGLALQIHDRDAHDDVLRILREEGPPEHTVLHCFSGDVPMARAAVELGLMLSFAGTVTFSSAQGLRDALAVDAAGAPARRDRRAVPHAPPVARGEQRVVPRAAHRADDGGHAVGRRPDAVHRALGQQRAGVRLVGPRSLIPPPDGAALPWQQGDVVPGANRADRAETTPHPSHPPHRTGSRVNVSVTES